MTQNWAAIIDEAFHNWQSQLEGMHAALQQLLQHVGGRAQLEQPHQDIDHLQQFYTAFQSTLKARLKH